MALEIEMLTVGPVAENCFLVRREGSERVLVVDPGEEAERILAKLEEFGGKPEAILITHCHFDHIGAVTPVAEATGAPVYCPEIEKPILSNIMAFVPWEGFGPFEDYEADETVAGGETLELAGLEIDVLFTPGHSPGAVCFYSADLGCVFTGDTLFHGGPGATGRSYSDYDTIVKSIKERLFTLPGATVVHTGHGRDTLITSERI